MGNAELESLLNGIERVLSAKLASSRRKYDKELRKLDGRKEPPSGADMGRIAVERLEYIRDEVRSASRRIRGGA